MKFPLLIATVSMLLTSFDNKKQLTNPDELVCHITSDKRLYKIGEVPKLNVEILNNSGREVFLIGSLDGSDVKARMPYCYFSIQKPIADTVFPENCPVWNTLRLEDFRWVGKGGKFNPYQHVDDYGFFWEALANNKRTYKNPGVYKIKFYYNAKSENIGDFMGTPRLEKDVADSDSLKMDDIFKLLSKVDLVSNEIEIRFQK